MRGPHWLCKYISLMADTSVMITSMKTKDCNTAFSMAIWLFRMLTNLGVMAVKQRNRGIF